MGKEILGHILDNNLLFSEKMTAWGGRKLRTLTLFLVCFHFHVVFGSPWSAKVSCPSSHVYLSPYQNSEFYQCPPRQGGLFLGPDPAEEPVLLVSQSLFAHPRIQQPNHVGFVCGLICTMSTGGCYWLIGAKCHVGHVALQWVGALQRPPAVSFMGTTIAPKPPAEDVWASLLLHFMASLTGLHQRDRVPFMNANFSRSYFFILLSWQKKKEKERKSQEQCCLPTNLQLTLALN